MGRSVSSTMRKLISILRQALLIENKKIRRKQIAENANTDNLVLKTNRFEDDYTQTKIVLGRGLNGKVVQCVNHHGKSFALKMIKDSPKARQEVSLHIKASDCDCIVKIVDVYINIHKNTNYLFVVMECMEGGELYDYLKKEDGEIDENEAAQLMRDICTAVKFLHDRNIVHRDLKLENLLLTRKNSSQVLKLTDFGFAKEALTNTSLKSPCYSPYYVAPEVLKRQTYGKSCDIWSLGVILYILLGSSPPFSSENSELVTPEMEKKIKGGNYSFPSNRWNNVSEDAKDVVRSCLDVNTENRINIDDILESKWMKKCLAYAESNIGEAYLEKSSGEKRQPLLLKDPKMSNSMLMMKRLEKSRTA
jgi:mitogen-activated protein kinase-activated protein kinase 2